MTYLFSPSTKGFYSPAVHGAEIPADAVEITAAEYAALFSAQAAGGTIQVDADGSPVAVPRAAPTLAQAQANLCASIDAAADDVYIAIGGPSPGRMAEYKQANTDATAYKAAGYSGAVAETVQCWATAQNWTAHQAADDILATAAAWEAILVAIRSARLGGKASVMAAATTDAAITAAAAAITAIQGAATGA